MSQEVLQIFRRIRPYKCYSRDNRKDERVSPGDKLEAVVAGTVSARQVRDSGTQRKNTV